MHLTESHVYALKDHTFNRITCVHLTESHMYAFNRITHMHLTTESHMYAFNRITHVCI